MSLFATTSYVLLAIQGLDPSCPLTVIPGGQFGVGGGRGGSVAPGIAAGSVLLRPCPDSREALDAELQQAARSGRILALFKLGHRWAWVRGCLEQHGLPV